LLELLVVIAIIAVLASLIFPALSKAKYRAKNVVCRNNLHQQGLALSIYVNDFQVFPLFENFDDAGAVTYWWSFLGLPMPIPQGSGRGGGKPVMLRHLGGVFWCPLNVGCEIRSSDLNGRSFAGVFFPSTSYGYNGFGVGLSSTGLGGQSFGRADNSQTPTREAAIRVPSDMLALGDDFVRSPHAKTDGGQNSEGEISPTDNYVLETMTPYKVQSSFKNHRGKFNRLLSDGHLEVEDMRGQFSPSDDYLRRWNTDNEPHRDLWQTAN
jgi:hypothetical protein